MELTRDELRRLAEQSQTQRLAAGEQLFREGEVAYYIRSGSLEIYSDLREHRQVLAIRGPGEIIGEMALLGDGRRGASARACQPCVVRTLSGPGRHSHHEFHHTTDDSGAGQIES